MFSIFPLFVPAIRDYIDVLNNAYDSISSDTNLQQILQESIVYFIASIKFIIIYCFSFQWVQDLSYLPIVIPQIKLEILKEHFFLQTPQSNFFTFLEIPSYTYNKFFLGFANSFFLCLPLSVAHIISIRRLLIQGLYAGIFSSFGTICGQILIFSCILFGGRLFITPWFNFQLVNYFVGIVFLLKLVYDMIHERSIRVIDSSNISSLSRVFLLNFVLAWTEQSCIFQYFGNLTLGPDPSIIEIFSSVSALQSILAHINYLIGIILGSILFTSLFLFMTLKLNNLCVRLTSILYSRWVRRLNFSLIILIMTFTLTSIPFYSFEYLILSNLGFLPQDKSFKNTNTVFSYTKIQELDIPRLSDQYEPFIGKRGIVADISRFNKGRYLMFDINDSFEQLNYKGEYIWLTRKSRQENISQQLSSSRLVLNTSRFFKKKKKFLNRQKNFSNDTTNKRDLVYDNSILENIHEENLSSELGKRTFDFRNESESMINESFENLINKSASQKFFADRKTRLFNLEKNFKQKYYSNPIYKLLLSADIDFFLSRQPKSFLLSPKQEQDLFQKRIILSNYYDSLRYYNEFPYVDEFHDFFNGSKSYADRIYNHQFNGTLKIVRRLFSIHMNPKNDPEITEFKQKQNPKLTTQNKFLQKETDTFILKFDQPLYKKINIKNYENFKENNLNIKNTESFNNREKNKTQNLIGANQSNSLVESKQPLFSSFFHEELNGNKKSTTNSNKQFLGFAEQKETGLSFHEKSFSKPFIELTNPIPFYVGWDEQLRKLVITNRILPNCFAGECMKFQVAAKNYNNDYGTLNKLIQKNKTINFTTWPISIFDTKTKNQINYNLLSAAITESKNKVKFEKLIDQDHNLQNFLNEDPVLMTVYGKLTSVPSNIIINGGRGNQIEKGELNDIIPYTRGGFIWPGHSDLKFRFKSLKFS